MKKKKELSKRQRCKIANRIGELAGAILGEDGPITRPNQGICLKCGARVAIVGTDPNGIDIWGCPDTVGCKYIEGDEIREGAVKKLNDHEKVALGMIDEQDAWYYKKMVEHANQVRSGKYGEVVKEWQDCDDCRDGFKVLYFVLLVPADEPLMFSTVTLKVTESGVFGKLVGSGWCNVGKPGE